MAYNIHNIKDFVVMDREMYFLDSNVWIWFLTAQQFGNESLKEEWHRFYADFTISIILLNSFTDKKTLKHIKQPKIIITSLLFSELTNAYMRGIMNAYMDEMEYKDDEKKRYSFKKFRKTLEYKDQHRNLIATFQQMSNFLLFIDDEFNSLKPLELFENLTDKQDFNDFYYYHLLKGKNITIVTDDGDFDFEDIEIITNRPSLLALMK